MTPSLITMTRGVIPEAGVAARLSCVDDLTLIDQFLRNDEEELFEILVRRYQEQVVRLAAAVLGPEAVSDAEDAAQEVFVVVLRRLKTFRRESAFSTWLYRVARNHIIDYRRRIVHRPVPISDNALQAVPDSNVSADPYKVLKAAQRRARILRCVNRLNEPQRVVVNLYYWQGQTVAEISELLGLRPGTVRSHLCRARQMLALFLRENVYHE